MRWTTTTHNDPALAMSLPQRFNGDSGGYRNIPPRGLSFPPAPAVVLRIVSPMESFTKAVATAS